jgi:acyl-CoA thioesterase FadM
MIKETPFKLTLLKINKNIIIGHNLIDENHHANHAKQHGLYEKERNRYMEEIGKIDKDALGAFGNDPFIVHVEGKYGRQMFEGDNVVIDTSAEIDGFNLVFTQSIGHNASSFKFVALNINENAAPYKIEEKPLPRELVNEISILPEWTNKNGNLTIEGYLLMYEIDRTEYFEKIVSDEELKTVFKLMPVVASLKGDCKSQIAKGDRVTILTSAEDMRSHILITQRVIKDGVEISRFQFKEALVNTDGRPWKVPPEISAKLTKFNTETT